MSPVEVHKEALRRTFLLFLLAGSGIGVWQLANGFQGGNAHPPASAAKLRPIHPEEQDPGEEQDPLDEQELPAVAASMAPVMPAPAAPTAPKPAWPAAGAARVAKSAPVSVPSPAMLLPAALTPPASDFREQFQKYVDAGTAIAPNVRDQAQIEIELDEWYQLAAYTYHSHLIVSSGELRADALPHGLQEINLLGGLRLIPDTELNSRRWVIHRMDYFESNARLAHAVQEFAKNTGVKASSLRVYVLKPLDVSLAEFGKADVTLRKQYNRGLKEALVVRVAYVPVGNDFDFVLKSVHFKDE